jgi:hypothetical protein
LKTKVLQQQKLACSNHCVSEPTIIVSWTSSLQLIANPHAQLAFQVKGLTVRILNVHAVFGFMQHTEAFFFRDVPECNDTTLPPPVTLWASHEVTALLQYSLW